MSPTLLVGLIALIGSLPVLYWSLSGANAAGTAPSTFDGTGPRRASVGDARRSRLPFPVPPKMRARAERRIRSAGVQADWTVDKVVLFKAVGAVLALWLSFLLLRSGISPPTVIGSVCFWVIGVFGVDVLLDGKAKERVQQVERTLPDVLDQVTISVEAGLGFEGALMKVVETQEHVLAQELGRALQDIQLGMPRADALMAMVDRVDVGDLRAVVRALNQTDKAGVPVAKVLRVQSEDMRERRRQRAEERAMAMPVKLIFPLVLFILPALFIVLIGPAALRLMETGLGG